MQDAQIPHSVLNAKFEAQEASIIAQAGRSGTVTIASEPSPQTEDTPVSPHANTMAQPGTSTMPPTFSCFRSTQVMEVAGCRL